jgi:U32 family peptidase
VRVASPRILKPGESKITNFLVSLDCPIVVRAAGVMDRLKGLESRELIGDFSLNAANSLTARILLEGGLTRLAPTHDLNAAQVTELAAKVGAENLEAIVYHHLPVFHTEHCVFCRFLSDGTSYRDCGRPCESHQVALRDHQGRSHPVVADVGCRNTVFGAEAQVAVNHLEDWLNIGIKHLRLEFAHETPDQVRAIVSALTEFLAGRCSSRILHESWKRAAPQGITEGSLFVPLDHLQLPVLQ